jgi:hypothetical protein
MTGKEVVGSDDHTIGHVVGERDGCAIVEMGHVFKSKHAVPLEFLHDHDDGVVRATIAKDLVADSPRWGTCSSPSTQCRRSSCTTATA